MGVNIKCQICGSSALAEQFRLHYKHKQVVCPRCFSGKEIVREPLQKRIENKADSKPKPPGWDFEDEYLEKMAQRRKEENQVQFSRIAGTNQVKCTCANCKYRFRYDPFRKMPRTCPYCNTDIPKLRIFNLL